MSSCSDVSLFTCGFPFLTTFVPLVYRRTYENARRLAPYPDVNISTLFKVRQVSLVAHDFSLNLVKF